MAWSRLLWPARSVVDQRQPQAAGEGLPGVCRCGLRCNLCVLLLRLVMSTLHGCICAQISLLSVLRSCDRRWASGRSSAWLLWPTGACCRRSQGTPLPTASSELSDTGTCATGSNGGSLASSSTSPRVLQCTQQTFMSGTAASGASSSQRKAAHPQQGLQCCSCCCAAKEVKAATPAAAGLQTGRAATRLQLIPQGGFDMHNCQLDCAPTPSSAPSGVWRLLTVCRQVLKSRSCVVGHSKVGLHPQPTLLPRYQGVHLLASDSLGAAHLHSRCKVSYWCCRFGRQGCSRSLL